MTQATKTNSPFLRTNLEFLMATAKIKSARELSKLLGHRVSQVTISRILRGEVHKTSLETIDELATFFHVSADDFRMRDLSSTMDESARGRIADHASQVLIRAIPEMLPPDARNNADWPFLTLPVSEAWYEANLDFPRESCALTIQPDWTLRGLIDQGDVDLVDTSDTIPRVGDPAIYAFTYLTVRHVKYISAESDGSFEFYGSQKQLNLVYVSPENAEKLRIYGRVKLHFKLNKI